MAQVRAVPCDAPCAIFSKAALTCPSRACSEPLRPYNKFTAGGGKLGVDTAWVVGDGTLGTFMSQGVVNRRFHENMRDLGAYGVSSKVDGSHPAWKYVPNAAPTIYRTPKRMRRGIAGEELGPTFVQ